MYSQKVMDHFTNPRNMGEMADANGVGEVGNAVCGDMMKMWIKVNDKGIIEDVKFKTFGCASAIASSSIATEMLIGKHIDDARKITNDAIADALDGLPPHKMHCSVLAAEAVNNAIDNYLGIKREDPKKEIICQCLGIDKGTIEEAILHGATTITAVRNATGAGTGACKGIRCIPLIETMLEQFSPH